MAFSARLRSSAFPRTYVGRWLRASMLGQREKRDQLIATLNGGRRVGWNDDEPAVVEAACELMLRRYYGTRGPDDASIEWLAALLHEGFASDNRPIARHKADAVIRAAALGNAAVDLSMISTGERYLVRTAVASFLALNLQLDENALDEILCEAEQIAFGRGWHPPLAPRRH